MRLVRAAAALALLLLPLAGADHVYSHRFVVEGRLVGANSEPIAGVPVEVAADGFSLGPACAMPKPRTDASGDFWFCFHNHALPDEGTVTVLAGNASERRWLDADLRRLVFLMEDTTRDGAAPQGYEMRHRVEGRLWWRMEMDLDGVDVHGLAMVHEPVTVELAGAGASGSRFEVVTDGFGDYEATFDLVPGQVASDLSVRVEARNTTLGGRLDARFHRTVVDFEFPFARPEGELLPGTDAAPVSPGLALTVGGAAAAMIALQRRKP